MTTAFMRSEIKGLEAVRREGKVRDIYDLGNGILLIVTTDRISAYDWILPNGIPNKGRVLQGQTLFWLKYFNHPNHFLTDDPTELAKAIGQTDLDPHLLGRSALFKKANPVLVECVVRGYLVGSGWEEYQKSGTVCGIELPSGLIEGARLDQPIFTPATKAAEGQHDENISFDKMTKIVGDFVGASELGIRLSNELKEKSLSIYAAGAKMASERGIIIADTKFEYGLLDSKEVILIDEVLTPDSSRFWPADQYRPGQSQPSFDKQFVRDWLTKIAGWDRNSPPPALPDDVVAKTAAKYIEAFEKLTGTTFEWK